MAKKDTKKDTQMTFTPVRAHMSLVPTLTSSGIGPEGYGPRYVINAKL